MGLPSWLLPPDTTLNIITRLPVESVFVCRRVCKTWRSLIVVDDTYIVDMHVKHQLLQFDKYDTGLAKVSFLAFSRDLDEQGKLYYIEYNTNTRECFYKTVLVSNTIINNRLFRGYGYGYEIIGSCNGLICFASPYSENTLQFDPVFIYNPVTREYVYLPKFNVVYGTGFCYRMMASGLGYIPFTNKYKVVRIYYEKLGFKPMVRRVQVYTLGDGNGWRDVPDTNNGVYGYVVGRRKGILFDGAIYWTYLGSRVIVFDLLDEELRLLPSPSLDFGCGLCVLRGSLCLVGSRNQGIEEIWTLKHKQNISSSYDCDAQKQDSLQSWAWTEAINMEIGKKTIDRYGIPVTRQPLALTNTGEIVLWDRDTLVLYDPKTGNVTKLGNPNMASFPGIEATPHVNSFVSLKAIGEDAKMISIDGDGVLDAYMKVRDPSTSKS